jgi:hypothetical protein
MTYPPGYPQAQQRTNVLAVASLLLSVLSFCLLPFIGAVAGIVLGHIARRQIRETGEEGAGLATAGIIVGWIHVVLGLLFVLGAVALLAFGVVTGNNVSPTPWPS